MFLELRFSPWVWQKLGAVKKLRWAWNNGKKYRVKLGNAPILVFPWVSPCLYFVFLPCALTVGFSSPMCLDIVAASFWRLLWMRNASQAMSVRTIVGVKCRVSEWAMAIVSEKCFKLQMWRFKLQVWGVEFLSEWMWRSWVNGLGLEFLMRSQSNKRSWKPLKAYLHPHSPLLLCKKEHHRARGPLTKGYHAKGTLTKGGFECAQQSRKSHSPQLAT